jgi:predicted dehydrogenase
MAILPTAMCKPSMPDQSARYIVSGAGHRAASTYLPALREGAGVLVGLVEPHPDRGAAIATAWPASRPPVEPDLETILLQTRPDWLIVTSPDHLHAEQIQLALALDVSVLTEKPMTINRDQAEAVLTAARASRAELVVAQNLRFVNAHRTLKELLVAGRIGRPVHAHLAYRLRPGHGRSYFTRWHRRVTWSGGLQVTKSCHHFDLLAWLLDDVPTSVYAQNGRHHHLLSDADIDDTLAVLLRFRSGATATYTLTSSAAWEGYELRIDGTDGGIAFTYEIEPPPGRAPVGVHIIEVLPLDAPPQVVTIDAEPGAHFGGDARMLAAFFGDTRAADPLRQTADGCAGALAVAVGEAVTQSSASGAAVKMRSLEEG